MLVPLFQLQLSNNSVVSNPSPVCPIREDDRLASRFVREIDDRALTASGVRQSREGELAQLNKPLDG